MPVWGFDKIVFKGKDPATWSDEDRAAASQGHVLTDPLEGLPILDHRRWSFNQSLRPGIDATVLHPLDGENRYHMTVATACPYPGQSSSVVAVMDLPSLDHAIAFANDNGLRIARVSNFYLSPDRFDRSEARPDE